MGCRKVLTPRHPSAKPFRMELLSSGEAAEQLGVNIQRFHRLVDRHGINPVLRAKPPTGVMFWLASDIDRLADELEAAS